MSRPTDIYCAYCHKVIDTVWPSKWGFRRHVERYCSSDCEEAWTRGLRFKTVTSSIHAEPGSITNPLNVLWQLSMMKNGIDGPFADMLLEFAPEGWEERMPYGTQVPYITKKCASDFLTQVYRYTIENHIPLPVPDMEVVWRHAKELAVEFTWHNLAEQGDKAVIRTWHDRVESWRFHVEGTYHLAKSFPFGRGVHYYSDSVHYAVLQHEAIQWPEKTEAMQYLFSKAQERIQL